MPAGDGTGPMGMGPFTGRAAGYCAGYSVPGYMNPYGGRPAFMGSMWYPQGMSYPGGFVNPGGPYTAPYFGAGVRYPGRGAYLPYGVGYWRGRRFASFGRGGGRVGRGRRW
jgi:hypothetical protein